jgi:transcription antitermination protein NusB
MGQRRRARESALQILFQIDFQDGDADQVILRYWAQNPAAAEVQDFAENIVRGVIEHSDEIDKSLSEHSTHWRLARMPAVDRNVLRIATFELLHDRDIDDRIIMNEAIEIARRFGTEESAAFVNGVLDAMAKKRS